MCFEPFHKVHPEPDSQDSVRLARQWLETCIRSHKCVPSGIAKPASLTRFVDVGCHLTRPFLAEFPPGELPNSWVALSYRWGSGPFQHPTVKKGSSLKQGFDLAALDATIRDAIIIVRLLGMQYIWIDALCIYQDDEEDWRQQAAQMCDIYGSSTLTLVAAGADRDSRGFLHPREHHYVGIPWNERSTKRGTSQQEISPIVYLSKCWPYENELQGCPWSQRGWTLQEGLLPGRMLIYTANQMDWKCCQESKDERGHRSVPLTEVMRGLADEIGGKEFASLTLFQKFKLLDWCVESRDNEYCVWDSLVEDYSIRQLTQPRDRLVAISGLARAFKQVVPNDEYVAGLWRSDLVRGMLWKTPGVRVFDVHQLRSDYATIPSWSWASVRSGVRVWNDWTTNRFIDALAKIQEVQLSLADPTDPFGQVTSAKVIIRAPTFYFSRLYQKDWQSQQLSAIQQYIYRTIEHEYGAECDRLSEQGYYHKYAAVMMLQDRFPPYRLIDVLILQMAGTESAGEQEVFRRLGVISLRHIDKEHAASDEFVGMQKKAEEAKKKSLNGRINPTENLGWRVLICNEVYQQHKEKSWPLCTLEII